MARKPLRASSDRVAAYLKLADDHNTSLYDSVQALVMLSDEDIKLTGSSRAELVSKLLTKHGSGEKP